MLPGEMLELWETQLWVAHLPLAELSNTSEVPPQITVVNPQIFVAIVAGLLMAFAFQLLLTNLGIALGITALGLRLVRNSSKAEPEAPEPSDANEEPQSSKFSSTARTIGFAAGLSILFTINLVLFAACFLATKLSFVTSPLVGAILGIVIWSAYFLLLIWISSTAVSSLVGTILGGAAAGLRSIITTIAAALKGKEDAPYLTEATAVRAIRHEVKAALNSTDVQDRLKAYVGELQPPRLELDPMRQELEALLQSPGAIALRRSGLLNQVDRQTFVNLLRDRTDFSRQDAEQVVDQLESIWQQAIAQSSQPDPNRELLQFFQFADPNDFRSDSLQTRLAALLPQTAVPQKDGGRSLKQLDFSALKRAVLSRIDLSDLDVETVWQQLLTLKHTILGEADADPDPPFSTIRTDIEAFLLGAYSWDLGKKALQSKFRQVIYDSEAAPDLVRRQLEQIQPADFADLLKQRPDLDPDKLEHVVDRLEQVRQSVLATVTAAEAEAAVQVLSDQLAAALSQTDALTPETVDRHFQALVEHSPYSTDELSQLLEQFDRAQFAQLLQQRSPEQRESDIQQLEEGRDRLLTALDAQHEQANAAIAELWQKLEAYFRYTKPKQFTAENVQRKLETLLEEAQSSLIVLPATVDRVALEKVLKRRKGLEKEQIQQIVDHVETFWQQAVAASQHSAETAKTQSDSAIAILTHYLQKLDGSNLMPENSQELMQQLAEMGIGTWVLKQLNDMDWQRLIEQLKQQGDISTPLLQHLRAMIQQAVKAPRRWATRSQTASRDFAEQLKDYLLNADKTDLSATALQANLTQLVQAAEQQTDRSTATLLAAPIDRDTITAVLLEREDVTPVEAAEMIDRLESLRLELLEQAAQTQQQMQTVFEDLLAQIRQSLQTLQLPELNAERIKQDFYKLLDLPQTGLERLTDSVESMLDLPVDALWQRLNQFNHDALEKLLKTRDDLSDTVRSRIVEQIESARSQVMQQVEQLQQDAQRRLTELKQQTQRQAEDTRKAAAIAAWWLFCTALSSLTTAAIAGILGVTGIHFVEWSQWIQDLLPLGRS